MKSHGNEMKQHSLVRAEDINQDEDIQTTEEITVKKMSF